MKYKAHFNNCIAQVCNIYGVDETNLEKDENGYYLETDDLESATLINLIDWHMGQALKHYKNLIERNEL